MFATHNMLFFCHDHFGLEVEDIVNIIKNF